MKLLKQITFFLLMMFGLSLTQSQQHQFQLIDAADMKGIAKADIYYKQTLIIKTQNGFFSISDPNLPALFTIKSDGYSDLTIRLNPKSSIQNIYLKQNELAISEIILRSTLIPQNLQDIPAAVNLIGQKEFERNDGVTILESLGTIPGLYINQGAINTNKITIRGIGARSQYSTNRIQSYFDGIPLATAEGELTLDDFDA